MAELTVLESKLGEVMGLAMAAQGATEKISELVKQDGDQELLATIYRIGTEVIRTAP
jgi:hypothetical protein